MSQPMGPAHYHRSNCAGQRTEPLTRACRSKFNPTGAAQVRLVPIKACASLQIFGPDLQHFLNQQIVSR